MMTETEIDHAIEFLQELKTARVSGKPYYVEYCGGNGWTKVDATHLGLLSVMLSFGWECRVVYKPRECWVNHYPDDRMIAHNSLTEAGKTREPSCTACVRYIEADDQPPGLRHDVPANNPDR